MLCKSYLDLEIKHFMFYQANLIQSIIRWRNFMFKKSSKIFWCKTMCEKKNNTSFRNTCNSVCTVNPVKENEGHRGYHSQLR